MRGDFKKQARETSHEQVEQAMRQDLPRALGPKAIQQTIMNSQRVRLPLRVDSEQQLQDVKLSSTSDCVKSVMHDIDPEGFTLRYRGRKRHIVRFYLTSAGPFAHMHADGTEKVAFLGFTVYIMKDRATSGIPWMVTRPNIRKALPVLLMLLECIESLGGKCRSSQFLFKSDFYQAYGFISLWTKARSLKAWNIC